MSANSGGLSEKEHGDGGPTNQPARSCRWWQSSTDKYMEVAIAGWSIVLYFATFSSRDAASAAVYV